MRAKRSRRSPRPCCPLTPSSASSAAFPDLALSPSAQHATAAPDSAGDHGDGQKAPQATRGADLHGSKGFSRFRLPGAACSSMPSFGEETALQPRRHGPEDPESSDSEDSPKVPLRRADHRPPGQRLFRSEAAAETLEVGIVAGKLRSTLQLEETAWGVSRRSGVALCGTQLQFRRAPVLPAGL